MSNTIDDDVLGTPENPIRLDGFSPDPEHIAAQLAAQVAHERARRRSQRDDQLRMMSALIASGIVSGEYVHTLTPAAHDRIADHAIKVSSILLSKIAALPDPE